MLRWLRCIGLARKRKLARLARMRKIAGLGRLGRLVGVRRLRRLRRLSRLMMRCGTQLGGQCFIDKITLRTDPLDFGRLVQA
jgi:hypothetical protein